MGWSFSPHALGVRRHVYEEFLASGRCSNAAGIMHATGLSRHELRAALDELERGVMVMLERDTDGVIIKCPPWANMPTPHVIELDGREVGYAGCALEALNMCFVYPEGRVRIRSACPDCGEAIVLDFDQYDLAGYGPRGIVLHVGVDPRRWGENWVAACANNNFFVDAEHVRRWEAEFPQHRGVTVAIEDARERIHYRNRLDYDRGADGGDGRAMVEWLRSRGTIPDAWSRAGE